MNNLTLPALNPINDPRLAANSPLGPGTTQRQRDFAEFLSTSERNGTRDKGPVTEAEARKAAEELVSLTFVQPLLAQARQNSNAAEPFHQTEGEKQFGSLMDAQIALDVVRSSRWDLVARSLMREPQQIAQTQPRA